MRSSLAFAAIMTVLPAFACAAPEACKVSTPVFSDGVKVVRLVKVVTGADGESHFVDTALSGVEHPLFNSGKTVTQTVLAEGAKVSLISGPANIDLPMHATPKTAFLELAGSSTVIVAGGDKREITPGVLVEFDDETSKSGHGGRTGPCGYVALSIGYAAPLPKPPG